MLRIRKYLKPYMLMLAASIILLFIQANLDLALPDLLARMVNTGVQLSGVESTVSEALRQETLERLTLFMNEEDAAAEYLEESDKTVLEETARLLRDKNELVREMQRTGAFTFGE